MGKKKIIISVVAFLVLLLISNGILHAYTGRNVWDYFFGDSEKDMSYMMEEYNQSISIDDYTITLDSAIFDEKTEVIYCMFRVSKNGEKVEASKDMYDTLSNAFGENGRFSLCVNADTGGFGKLTGKYEGNDLIIYGRFSYHCDRTVDEHAIYLFDANDGITKFEDCTTKFELKPTAKNIEVSDGIRRIYVSPLAIKIESETRINTETISILNKDGSVIELVNKAKEKGIGGSSSSKTAYGYSETYIIENLIDVEQIESILYNNEIISPVYIYGEETSIDITNDEKSELCVSYLINRGLTEQVNYIQGNIVSMNDYNGGVLLTIRFVGVSNQNEVYGELVLPSDGTWYYADEKMSIGDSITIGYIGQLKGIQEENSYYGDIIWCEIGTHIEVITSGD